jgi:hypothetical protein
MPYLVRTPQEVLTSFKWWVVQLPKANEYQSFGVCRNPSQAAKQLKGQQSTTGNCIVGGRVGYSVKLVDFSLVRAQAPMTISVSGGNSLNGNILSGTNGPTDAGWFNLTP